MLDSIWTVLLFLYWALMSHHFITQSDILDCQNVRNQPVKSVVSPLNKVLGVEGHPLQTYLLVFLVLFLFFLCFFAVAKRRKRATAQQQEWDMQWVTGCAPGSPLLLYESHRAAGAPRTCHTDSHLTNRGLGPLWRPKHQQPKSRDEETTPAVSPTSAGQHRVQRCDTIFVNKLEVWHIFR